MSLEDLLVPWTAERILYEASDVLAVDKPAGCVVHGGDARHPSDLVTRLSAWLQERSEPAYLGVHQRLDQEASGAMILTRGPEGNRAVSTAFEAHELERRYVAVVTGSLQGEGRWVDGLCYDERRRRSRIVSRGGLEAVTRFRVVERAGDRALVELFPETGRTHQLRVQLATRGAPIVGDAYYGGALAPRLFLHAAHLDLPVLGRRFESAVPEVFTDWLTDGAMKRARGDALARALRGAGFRRWPLRRSVTAHRLVDGAADGIPGVTVDRYDDYAVVGCHDERSADSSEELSRLLRGHGAAGVYVQNRVRADLRKVSTAALAPSAPVIGHRAPDRLEVHEGAARLWVFLGEGWSTGLFTDQRDNRDLIASMARGKRFLNLFCYTGAFTIAAALGGARESISVDLAGRALERLRENLELNGLSQRVHRSVKEDAFAWLRRARKRGELFDLIVLDPPSFGTRGARTFSVDKDYPALSVAACSLLGPGGTLLAVTNHRKTTAAGLRRILRAAAVEARRPLRRIRSLAPPLDYPDRPGGAAPTKSVLLTIE